MAVDLCPGSPTILCSSPRISFSHDLDHHDHVAQSDQNQNLLLTRLSSNDSDFEFRLPAIQFPDETSTADELFSGGMIVPTNIKERNPNPALLLEATTEEEEDDIIMTSTRANLIREEKGNSKSFWGFMRSSSLNSGSKKASIWSSLPLLARSNSTGSSSPRKQHSHGGSSTYRKSPKPNSSAGFPQKPPLGKSYSSVSPVLNVGTSDLLGLGSLFRHGNGNEKKGKKR